MDVEGKETTASNVLFANPVGLLPLAVFYSLDYVDYFEIISRNNPLSETHRVMTDHSLGRQDF